MVKVMVEVRTDSQQFLVRACAESIQKALKRVEDRYGRERYKIIFPLDPELFFAVGSTVEADLEELEMSDVVGNARKLSRPTDTA